MDRVYLFIEGVNLSRCITDTNDLATVRGSSMILETLGAAAETEFKGLLLEEGASRALLRFDAKDAPSAPSVEGFLAAAPWRHFTCAFGLGESPEAAEHAARLYQLKMVNLPVSSLGIGRAVDALNHSYPAETTCFKAGDPPKDIAVSHSVACRRDEGQKLRPWLYKQRGLEPPRSFEDIILRSDETAFVADAKLAVVKADGMGGTKLREGFEARFPNEPDEGRLKFNAALTAMRKRLAAAIEGWLESEALFHKDGMLNMRPLFDVLVWGGDDMTFVLPAEHLLGFLEVFFTEVDRAEPEGFEAGFPHRVGCIIANYKTPVRQLVHLAESAEYAVKQALGEHGRYGESAFSIDVFESSSLPYDGVRAYRQSLYGSEYRPGSDVFLASDLDKLQVFFAERLGRAEDGTAELTTTQIHRALSRLLEENVAVSGSNAASVVRGVLDDHFQRIADCDAPIAEWLSSFSELPKSLPMLLAQVAQLSPYVMRRDART